LLRLRHMYEAGEHPTLSLPAKVDVAALFKHVAIVNMQETTLSGAPPLSPPPTPLPASSTRSSLPGNALLSHTTPLRWTSEPVPQVPCP
jgi:hypothetical protein